MGEKTCETTLIKVCACPYGDGSGYAVEVEGEWRDGAAHFRIVSEGFEFEHLPHLIAALKRVQDEFSPHQDKEPE